MKKPELPKNEAQRIEALHALGILDTPPEKRFDRITRLASKIFGVPVCYISLVDENRIWFKSSTGLKSQQLVRHHSLCAYTILENKSLIVEDTLEDERFAEHPLVKHPPNVRFYAGFPLTNNMGYRLGTLSIMDTKPREFSVDQIQILKLLSAMAQRELELSRVNTVDELTQIPNLRGFTKLAQQSLNLSRRSGLPSTLVKFDLNEFKQLNKTLGDKQGDRIMILFAESIMQISRDSDIFARLRSDEFVILFIDSTRRTVDKIIERFSEQFKHQLKLNKMDVDVGFSHSTVEFLADKHITIDDLLEEADKVMGISH